MFARWCWLLVWSALSFSAGAVSVHDLSLRVVVDEVEVMAPMLQVVAGRPAYVTVGEGSDDAYTLEVVVPDTGVSARSDVTTVQTVLWRGGVEHGEQLISSSIALEPRGPRRAAEDGTGSSVELRSRMGRAVEIHVASHAISTIEAPIPTVDSCLDENGLVARALAKAEADACCSAKCRDGSGQTLRCCGGTRCCACGTCCSPP